MKMIVARICDATHDSTSSNFDFYFDLDFDSTMSLATTFHAKGKLPIH